MDVIQAPDLVGLGRLEEAMLHAGREPFLGAAPVEVASAEPLAKVGGPCQQVRRALEVASKEPGGCDSGRHDLGIQHAPLRALFVTTRPEPTIDEAVCSDNSGVHRPGVLKERVSRLILSISNRDNAFFMRIAIPRNLGYLSLRRLVQ